jgi:hypothetical protein
LARGVLGPGERSSRRLCPEAAIEIPASINS